jgi:hypothetical protein
MEAAESGVSLLLGESAHLHHIDPRQRPCIFSEQQGCSCVASSGRSTAAVCPLRRCIYIAVTCASTTVLRNPRCAIHLHKVFVLLIGSSSSSCPYPHRR